MNRAYMVGITGLMMLAMAGCKPGASGVMGDCVDAADDIRAHDLDVSVALDIASGGDAPLSSDTEVGEVAFLPLSPMAESFRQCESDRSWYAETKECCVFEDGLWVLQKPCEYYDPGCDCPPGFQPQLGDEPGCVNAQCVPQHPGACDPLYVIIMDDPDKGKYDCPDAVPFLCHGDGIELPDRFCTDCPCPMLAGQSSHACQCGDDYDSCNSPEECIGEMCVPFDDYWSGGACTSMYSEACYHGWVCVLYPGSCPDCFFPCMPPFVNLCRPCSSDDECVHAADENARCMDFGDAGSFCGANCGGWDTDCPKGYACTEFPQDEGEPIFQCLPKGGECECKPRSIVEHATTTCMVTNEYGTCPGERFCSMEGLTDCDAPTPAPESCDGIDNDCDGEVDEDLDLPTCTKNNAFGSCDGAFVCKDGGLMCDAPEAKPETCDGLDNDCDGKVDEDFPDSNGNGIPDCGEPVDPDDDGVPVYEDNCPWIPNPDQADFDQDSMGDVCDPDDDNDMVKDEVDCEPFDPDVYPGAVESCDGLDNNCNDKVDEGYQDLNLNGIADCIEPDDDQDNDGDPDTTDCMPFDPEVYTDAPEKCDGKDNDCDYEIDEGCQ